MTTSGSPPTTLPRSKYTHGDEFINIHVLLWGGWVEKSSKEKERRMGGWTHSSQRRPQLCGEKGKNMWLKTSRDWSRAEYWNSLLLLLLLLRVHFHRHIKILRILRPAQVALAAQPNAFSVPGSGSGSGSGATVTWFATRRFGFTAKPHYTVVKSETSERGCHCFVITGWGLSGGPEVSPGTRWLADLCSPL